MHTSMQRLALVVLLFLLAACAPSKPFPVRILWPPPPARPYMELKNVFYSQDQFPKGGFEVFLEGLVGKGEQSTFSRPFGVAGNNRGLVYISDPNESNVRVYDFNNNTVEFYSKDPVGNPYGLAVDREGKLYIADPTLPGVLVFSADRKPLRTIGSKAELTRPVHLALNERLGRLYVSDGEGGRVVVYSPAGDYLFTIGKRGPEPGDFAMPVGIAIDKEDRVFVTDSINANVNVFTADGQFLYRFGELGDNPGQMEQPRGLAFDSTGNLYVVDARKGALQTFTPDGTFLLYTGAGKPTHLAEGFNVPTSIWIDKDDQIFVTDTMNKRLALWQAVTDDYLAAHPVTPEEIAKIQALVEAAKQEAAKQEAAQNEEGKKAP